MSDSDTRVRLAPRRRERDALRERLRDLAAANPQFKEGRWAAAVAAVEREIGEFLPLDVGAALVEELANVNDAQACSLIRFQAEQLDRTSGELERVHLFDDGGMIVRVLDEKATYDICVDLMVPPSFPSSSDFDLFAHRRAEGGWQSLVVGRERSGSGELGGQFELYAIHGPMPGWDDRDSMWDAANIDVEDRLAGAELPLREWFAVRRNLGWSITWDQHPEFEIHGVRTLIYAFDFFSWSPRRFIDGRDERFGIEGPTATVELTIGVRDCLRWLVEEAQIWEFDPALVADAFFVMRAVAGDLWLDGIDLKSAETLASAIGSRHDDESQSRVARFAERLRELLALRLKTGDLPSALPPRQAAEL